MDLQLLQEKHNFKRGDNVIVLERNNKKIHYSGTIYNIVHLPVNKYISQLKNIFVDYFYISFSSEVYYKFLTRGHEVIYNHKPAILKNIEYDKNGHIQKIYKQDVYTTNECEIDFDNINAVLVWRVAYEIKPTEDYT